VIYRSGLFLVKEDQIEFRHLLLQEFFAGRGIPTPDFLQTVIADDWWRRAIVFHFGDNADDIRGVQMLIDSLTEKPLSERYAAATTIGLILQACYLAKINEKIDLYCWVIDALASASETFEKAGSKSELSNYLNYYFFARDAVAAKLILSNAEDIHKHCDNAELIQSKRDLRMFWLIIGHIEAGMMPEAEKLVKRFRPNDTRLLLAIHLGSYLVKEIRVVSSQAKAVAHRICTRLMEPISYLRKQLLDELKTELLEWRKGTVIAIEAPKDTSGQDSGIPKKIKQRR